MPIFVTTDTMEEYGLRLVDYRGPEERKLNSPPLVEE
jgi:hypothetical protein